MFNWWGNIRFIILKIIQCLTADPIRFSNVSIFSGGLKFFTFIREFWSKNWGAKNVWSVWPNYYLEPVNPSVVSPVHDYNLHWCVLKYDCVRICILTQKKAELEDLKHETFIILQFVLIIHPFHMVTSSPKMHFQRFPPLNYQTKLRVPLLVRVVVKLVFNF